MGPKGGAVHVLYGSSAGLQAALPDDQLWTMDTVAGVASQARANFGESLAVGDFDHDGYKDLAIGVPWWNVGSGLIRHVAGAVAILYGGSGGLHTGAAANTLFTQDSPNVAGAAHPKDRFGTALASGDFNADGYADLAVGAPGEAVDAGASFDAGFVSILKGSASGLVEGSPASA